MGIPRQIRNPFWMEEKAECEVVDGHADRSGMDRSPDRSRGSARIELKGCDTAHNSRNVAPAL
jgi:hypothetical protein